MAVKKKTPKPHANKHNKGGVVKGDLRLTIIFGDECDSERSPGVVGGSPRTRDTTRAHPVTLSQSMYKYDGR